MKNSFKATPPNAFLDLPIIHKFGELYKSVYALGPKLSKRDRYGIYLKIENNCLDAFTMALQAALLGREEKKKILVVLKIKTELLKQLVRMSRELNIIGDEKYIHLESHLQEISKMTTGWIKYLT